MPKEVDAHGWRFVPVFMDGEQQSPPGATGRHSQLSDAVRQQSAFPSEGASLREDRKTAQRGIYEIKPAHGGVASALGQQTVTLGIDRLTSGGGETDGVDGGRIAHGCCLAGAVCR
jgi:hypothetical protein